jgi:hypothetical protein
MPNTDLQTRLSVVEHSLEIRLEAAEKALKLQAEEYSRRLDILNGEADRLRQMQSTYVPRELWDNEHRRLMTAIDSLNSFRDASLGRYSAIAILVSGGVSIFVGLLVHVLGK